MELGKEKEWFQTLKNWNSQPEFQDIETSFHRSQPSLFDVC